MATDASVSLHAGQGAAADPPAFGMAWIPGGTFRMGSDRHYPEESWARMVAVDGFWMDRWPVTNAQFAAFVASTGHVSVAERTASARGDEALPGAAGSLVFVAPAAPVSLDDWRAWWRFVPGANWRTPRGPASTLDELADHPVVHVAWEDAQAYATWAGKTLPTEAEFEFAARGGLEAAEFAWGDQLAPQGRRLANYWQGEFPWRNLGPHRHTGTSPVEAFPANPYGLHDLIGNVWELTLDWWAAMRAPSAKSPCCVPRNPRGGSEAASGGERLAEPAVARKVIKGGSHLCCANYCERYRPAARLAQPVDTTTGHVGFRCVVRP